VSVEASVAEEEEKGGGGEDGAGGGGGEGDELAEGGEVLMM